VNPEKLKLQDITDTLIDQQFYQQGDIITGRTPTIKVKISKSGQVVKKFKDLFNQNLNFFLEGDYEQFLIPFKKIKGMNENTLQQIYKDLHSKIDMYKDEYNNSVEIMTYTLVLSTLITRIRDVHFNDSLEEIKKRVMKRSSKLNAIQIQEELDKLFMQNNDNISILYNISYLDALAESFNYKKVARVSKIMKSKYTNRVVELILASNDS
jgi:hypothetical protein